MLKINFGIGLVLLFASLLCSSEPVGTIKAINKAVELTDKSIDNGEYASLDINENSVSEGSPPALIMYFKGKQIKKITVSVGHETWTNEFCYYYYDNGKPMKYIKTTKDRPDNPPKEAVIYNEKGEVVWKNTDNVNVSSVEVYALFLKIQEMRMAFSKY